MVHHPVPPTNRSRARKMRKAMSDAELKLWNELRAHRLMDLAFRQQMPIAGYIVDFACPAKKLVVEIDGSQHADAAQSEADTTRARKLEALGWTVLRFWNDDVLRDIDNVCRHIVISADPAHATAPTPSGHHRETRP
jgi:very-short-patch-repair endonuclease